MGHSDEANRVDESTKHKKLKSVLFLSTVLLFATFVAFPNQQALAHESGWHEFCWDETLTMFDFLIDVAKAFVWLFGPAIVVAATIVAIGLGLIAVQFCHPQLIPPPQNTAKALALECNTFEDIDGDGIKESAFRAEDDDLNKDGPRAVLFLTTGKFTSSVTYNDTKIVNAQFPGEDIVTDDLPDIHYINVLIPFMTIMIPAAIGQALGLFPGLSALKELFINILANALFGVFDYKFALNQFDQTKQDGSIAHAAFGFRINDINFNPTLTSAFTLGTNEIEYVADTRNGFGMTQGDTATFYFNVIDTIPPKINFENQTIVLEANAHFGFKVDQNSIHELGEVTVFDACAGESIQPHFMGPSFMPLTKIKEGRSQLAVWYTEDIPYSMYPILPEAMQEALDRLSSQDIAELDQQYQIRNMLIQNLTTNQTPENWVDLALANFISPSGVSFGSAGTILNTFLDESYDKWRSARLLDISFAGDPPNFKPVRYFDDTKFTGKIKNFMLTTPKDIAANEDLFKKIDLDNKFVKNLKNADARKIFKKSVGGEFAKSFGSKAVGSGLGAVATFGGEALGGAAGPPQPIERLANSALSGQIVKVIDTIPPDIFIPRHVAIEANTTDPNSGCFNSADGKKCNVTINTPLLFDVADPFPQLMHNFTADGSFTNIDAPKLTSDFPVKLTKIAWKAVDFSENISDEVVLLVNIKEIGTNKVSRALNQTVPVAFFDTPIDITVNATNPDSDPLEFLVQENPDDGIIESPIEAVFQNKFQKEGIISRLTGLTADPSGTFADPEFVFFSDAENERVMKINSETNMLDVFFNTTGVSDRPEALALTGTGNFIISNWQNNTIVEAENVNGQAVLRNSYDVEGLFEDPRNLSVDWSTGAIYVTDIQNGTISKLNDFEIFSSPSGIATNNTHVTVADTTNHRVLLFDTKGKFVQQLGDGTQGSALNQFDNPKDVEFDSSNSVYVIDQNNDRISKFDSGGGFVEQIGPKPTGDSFFNSPRSIATNSTQVYVADTGNNRIQKFNLTDGSYNFFDDYNANATWNASPSIGVTVTVDDESPNVVSFAATPSGNGVTHHGVSRPISTLPESGWRSDFEITTGTNTATSNAFVWLVTDSNDHPSNGAGNLDALAVYLTNNELQIYQEHAGTNSTSTGILISDNTTYYVTLERLNSTEAALGVFDDAARTNHIANSPVITSIDSDISGLDILQHANDFSNGGNTINLELDNTSATAIFLWLGKCTSGPNCNSINNISQGFVCTDTTCSGLSSDSGIGQFDLPTGLDVNQTNIFVADNDNHRVQIFDADGIHQQTLGTGTPGSANGQFDNPSEVSVDGLGGIYVSDTDNDRVQIFNRFGDLVSITGTSGSADGQFIDPLDASTDLLGNLYVSDTGNNRIQKFSLSGSLLDVWQSSINSQFPGFIEQFSVNLPDLSADSIALDSVGDIFIGDWNSENKKRIVKLTRNADKIPVFDITNLVDDPKSIAINSTNFVFVTDHATDSVVVFDPATNFESIQQTIELSILGINPTGITIDNNDSVIVSDWDQEKIITLNLPSTSIANEFNVNTIFKQAKDIGVDDTHFYATEDAVNKTKIIKIRKDKGILSQFEVQGPPNALRGLTLGQGTDNDIIFLANSSDGRIVRLNTTSGFTNTLVDITAKQGIIPDAIATNPVVSKFFVVFANVTDGDLGGPTGLAFGPDSNLYASSSFTRSIKVFDGTTGDYIDDFVSDNRLQSPQGLIFTQEDDPKLLVSDLRRDKVYAYNATTGDFIDVFAKGGGMDGPVGLAYGPDGNLYVSNSINDNILSFNGTTGNRIGQFVPANDNGGLLRPQGLTFGPDENLYVSSFLTDTIKRFNGTSGEFLDDFVNSTQLTRPTGLAFDPSGKSLFVSSFDTSKIIEFNATTGRFIGQFGSTDIDKPKDLIFGPDQRLYVSSFGTDEIIRYGLEPVTLFLADWNSKLIHGLDENGTAITVIADLNGRAGVPHYIATDSVGDIWITFTDGNAGRIEVLRNVDGTILENIDLKDIPVFVTEPTTTVMSANGTEMTFDEDGNIVEKVEVPTTSISPEGISIDSKDRVYVSDWNNNRIIKLNIVGEILEQLKVNSTFINPLDIAVDIVNTETEEVDIFVADGGIGNITEIRSSLLLEEIDLVENVTALNGITTKNDSIFFTNPPDRQILELNATNHLFEISDVFVEPEGIAVDDADSIYVTDWKNERILEFDSAGNRVGDPIDMEPAKFVDNTKLRDIEVEIGPPISFWVADSRTATLPMLIPGDQFDFAAAPSVADKFVLGSGIAVDSQENFIFASTKNNTLIKFDEAGTLLTNRTFAEHTMLEDVWSSLDPLTELDLFYLAQRSPDQIVKMNAGLGDVNSTVLSFAPTSVATDSAGNIFVSGENNIITKFDSSFNFVQEISIPVGGNLTDLAIDPKDNLYAADFKEHRIHKINATTGEFVGWLGKCVSGSGCNLNQEHSKGFSCTEDTSVCDAPTEKDKKGRGISQFFKPADIAVDRLGNLYVADLQVKPKEMNAPRIQKFSTNGFFIENTLSDTTKTRIKGNFVLPKAIAVGSSNFFVLDESKLHVFDVNPFSPIRIEKITNITSSDITYKANLGFVGLDKFRFMVDDGFARSDPGIVNVTVFDPDGDNDNIFIDVEVDPAFSNTFSDVLFGGKTSGTIVDRGGQILIIRDAKEENKGVFIQADVTPINPTRAEISACDDSVTIYLNEGNQIHLTCEAATIEVIRGEVDVSFFDKFGRNGTVTIPILEEISFEPVEYQFIANSLNEETLDVNVQFNNKSKIYEVMPGKTIKVDTAPPDINAVCPNQLSLEAEIIPGVDRINTNLSDLIDDFLVFTATDVDNGSPKLSSTDPVPITHNAPELLSLNFTTTVIFSTIDEVGNIAECESLVSITDTTPPEITFPTLVNNMITAPTLIHDDSVVLNFDTGEARDLPPSITDPRPLINGEDNPIVCVPSPDYAFPIGRHTVYCQIPDASSIVGRGNFTINITPTAGSLTVLNVTAIDDTLPAGYSDGDKVVVKFSQPTNMPSVSSKSQVDSMLTMNPNPIGSDYEGFFVDPSILILNITQTSIPAPMPGVTTFTVNAASGLTNAAGTITPSLLPSPVMDGSFTSKAAPFIKAFLVHDPEIAIEEPDGSSDGSPLDDIEISVGDKFTIVFSEPTNRPGGVATQNKAAVDALFEFPGFSLGDNYQGRWISSTTFEITILELNTIINLDPVIGLTVAKVKQTADLKNVDETSVASKSISLPLQGSFGTFTSTKKVLGGHSAISILQSGISVQVKVPVDARSVGITNNNFDADNINFLGNTMDVTTSDEDSCELGCEISFTFLRSHLSSDQSLATLSIFHDENNDGVLLLSEKLVTTIEEIAPDTFTAKATIFSTSIIGLGSPVNFGGGSDGDSTSPRFSSHSVTGSGVLVVCPDDPNALCQGAIVQDVIQLTNSMPTARIETGKPVRLSMLLYENSGIEGVDHISIYMNLQGLKRFIHQSDTFIRLHQGSQTISDPNGFFKEAKISLIPRGKLIEAVFDITFDKPMETSNVLFRAWDHKLNSRDAKFLDAIEVIEPQTNVNTDGIDILFGKGISDESTSFAIISEDILNKWAGFSTDTVSDSELLSMVGLEGNSIPSWYKEFIVEEMIKNGIISEEELLNALTYFYDNELLGT